MIATNIKRNRRQKFMDEVRYSHLSEWLISMRSTWLEKLATDKLTERARDSMLWRLASESLQHILLNYTAGMPLAELREQLPGVVAAFDAFIAQEPDTHLRNEAQALEITQLESYVYVIWLLGLCKLLGHPDLVPRVMSWIDKNAEFNRGRDGLFEFIVHRLLGTQGEVERVLLHPSVYRSLAKATVSPPEERPALVAAFLKDWYKNMDPCYWQGLHTDPPEQSLYFGYWSLEAALVTVLWDIDDTSYRDHLVYPKDLVSWAREHGFARPIAQGKPILVMTGDPAPHSGLYAAYDGLAPEVRVQQGQPLPMAEDLMDAKRPSRTFTWILRQRADGGPVTE